MIRCCNSEVTFCHNCQTGCEIWSQW